MKYRIIIFCLILILFIYGCVSIPSLETYTNGWMGRPVAELQEIISSPTSHASKIEWKETTYQLNNGNWVYVTPDVKDCFIHWEINPDGIIVGYRLEDEGCKGH